MIHSFFPTLLDSDKPSLFVVFEGCNMRCFFCHNAEVSYLTQARYVSVEEQILLNYLSKPFARDLIDVVVFSGGEPTIYGEKLINLAARIKDIGYSIKLDTNGTNPKIIKSLVELELVDYISMDIKASLSKYELLGCKNTERVKESIEFLKNAFLTGAVAGEFRTTLIPNFVLDKDIEEIQNLIKPLSLKLQTEVVKTSEPY